MLGDTLRYLRKNRDYTQAYVADMLNISPGSYGRYENNEREPDVETLTKLANLFGITLDELITGRKQMPLSVSKRKGVKIPVLGRVVAGIPLDRSLSRGEWRYLTEAEERQLLELAGR